MDEALSVVMDNTTTYVKDDIVCIYTTNYPKSRYIKSSEKYWVSDFPFHQKNFKTTLEVSVNRCYLEKLNLITAQKKYFKIEEKRVQEKHNAEQLRV